MRPCLIHPSTHPLIHPCSPHLSFPTPPSTLLARPRRLTDSAADRPGPSHLSGCRLLLRAVVYSLKVTKSRSHCGRRKPTVSLAWPCMASHAQNWAPISLSFLSSYCTSYVRPCNPLFLLLCSGSALSCPVPSDLYIQDSSSLRRLGRLAVRLPPPRPFLNYTCIAPRLVGSYRQNTNPTQPNPTRHTRAHTHTLLLPTYPTRLDPK